MKRKSLCPFLASPLLVAALIAAWPKPLVAVDGSWTPNAGGSWGTAGNWSSNPTIPGTTAGDVININSNITAAQTITLDGSRTMGDLNIGDSGTGFFGFTINAGTGGTLIMDAATGSASIDFLNTGTNGAANTIGAGITLNDALIIRSNNDKVQTLSGVINDGAASLSLTFNNDLNGTAAAAASGQGQFILSNANTYDGGTTINDVRVNATNATAFGTGAVTISGAGQAYFSTAITVTNSFNLNSIGWTESAGNLGALRIDGGAILSGTITLQANSPISVNSGTGTISGAIGGAFSLTKSRGGTLVLSGANTYTGGTTISGGILQLGSGGTTGSLSTTGAISIATGSVFAVNQTDTVTQGTEFSGGAISGAGGFTQAGSGTTILNAANTYTGNTTVSAGTLRGTVAGAFGAGTGAGALTLSGGNVVLFNDTATTYGRNTTVTANGTITTSRATAGAGVTHTLGTLSIGAQTLTVTPAVANSGIQQLTFGAVTMTGNSIFNVTGGRLNLGALTGPAYTLTKQGGGTLGLTGAGLYNGGTNVDAGVIIPSNATALGFGAVNFTSGDTGRVSFTGGISYANDIVVSSGVTGTSGQGLIGHTGAGGVATLNGTLTLSGLTGVGGLIIGSNTAGQELRFNGAINQTSSNIGLSQRDGRIIYAGGGNVSGNFVVTGTAFAGATNGIPQALTAQLGGSGAATLNLNGFDQSLVSLIFGFAGQAHSGTVTLGSNVLTLNGGIDVAAGTTPTHSINGAGSVDTGGTARTFNIANTTSAVDLTINSALTGSGGFTKLGAGTLAINNTVEGPVTLGAGVLQGTGTFSGGLTVSDLTTLNVGATTSVGTLATTTLVFGSGTHTLGVNVGSAGTDLINVTTSGGLTQSGTTTFQVSANGGFTSASTFYPLISYTGTSPGTSGFALGTLPGRVTGSVSDSGTAIGLMLANDRVIWSGVTNGTWDVNTTQNWKTQSAATPTNFLSQDDIIFNNDGIAQNTIALTGTIDPVRVEFAHTTGNTYTLASGTLTGTGNMPLVLNGGGTLVLKNTNTYTGPTTITNNSTLELDQTSGTLTNTSGVQVDGGSTLKLTRNNGNISFNRNISGAGTVFVDANVSGTAGPREVALTGNNSGFSGTWDLDPSGTFSTNGTFRTNAAVTQNNLGTANVIVRDGAQLWISGTTISNNLTLSGAGFQEAAGGTPTASATGADGSTPAVPILAYGGIGAVRLDANGNLSGSITLSGDTKIMPYGTTGTISGNITNAASSDDLIVGGGGAGTNLFLTGDNSALERIWVNGGGTAGTNQLIIGNNTTTGTLGSGDVILYQDAAAATLRFQRSDGYTMGASQNIIAAHDGTATNLSKANVVINTTGTGFSLNGRTIDLSDGTNGGGLFVGGIAGADGIVGAILNIDSGSTIEVGRMDIGNQATATGIVNQTGGAVSIINQVRVGTNSTADSIYNMSGGSLTITANTAAEPSAASEVNGAFYIGVEGTGVVNHSAGTISTGALVLDNRTATAGADQYNLSGTGILELRSSYGLVARNADPIINLSGGTIRNTGADGTDISINAPIFAASGSTTLDTVNGMRKFSLMSSITGSGTITTTGGGLVELEPDSNTTRTSVSTGTGTQSISAVLAGTSAFTKVGTGTTTLSGANTYSGATTVSAGRLNLTGSVANSALTANDSTVIGGEGTAASLTFGNSVTDNVTLFIDGVSSGALTSTGALTVSGTVKVDFTVLPTVTTGIVVLNHGSSTALPANFALANPASFRPATFNVNPTNVTMDLAKAALVWDGSTATWEIAGGDNDWNGVTPENFFNNDDVTFDDSLIAANQTITLGTTVQPGSVTANNSTYSYSITGAGGISGNAGITKSGTNLLELGGTNTYTGTVNISAGTLKLVSATALGSTAAGTNVSSGGTLDIAGPGAGFTANTLNLGNEVVTISGTGVGGNGAITNSSANQQQNAFKFLTLAGDATIGGTGRYDVRGATSILDLGGFKLTKVGANIVYATVDGTITGGDIEVTGGTLGLWNATANSTGTFTAGTGGILELSNTAAGKFFRPIVLNGGTLTAAAAAVTEGGVTLASSASTVNNAFQLTINGIVSETGGAKRLVKTGAAALVLVNAANSFSDGVDVSTNILRVANDTALGPVPGSADADNIILRSGGLIQGGTAAAGVNLTINPNRGVSLPSGDGGFHVWSGFTMDYAGAITGVGRLTKSDTGTLNYSGTASHTGGTLISAGTANLNAATISSTSILNVATATLNINSGTSITTPRFTTSEGASTVSTVNQTGGTLNVTGTDSSNTNTASFLFGHWGTGASSTYNLSGGTLNSVGAELSFGWDATVFFNQTGGTANLLGLDLGNTRNNLGIYSLNGGQLNLGANGITTNTNKVVNLGGGTLGAFANWSTAQAMQLTGVNGNATINTLDSADNTTARSVTISGVLSGLGGLNKTGAGSLTLTGANTYTGATNVTEGNLVIGTAGTIAPASTVTVGNGATLRFDRNDVWGNHQATTSSPIVVNQGGTLATNGNFNTVVNPTLNGGTVTLNGGASANYPALAIKGILTAGGSAASSINVGTGSFNAINIGPSGTGGTLTVNVADATASTATDLTINAVLQNNRTADGSATVASSLTKIGLGTLAITTTSAYTGATTVNGGTLHIEAGASIASSSLLTVNSGGAISGSGTIGATLLNAGSEIRPEASLASSPGLLTAAGDFTVSGAATFVMDIDGPTAATEYDQLSVSGVIDIGSTSILSLSFGAAPTVGDKYFLLLNDGSDAISGLFDGIADGSQFTSGGYVFSAHYGADSSSGDLTGGNDFALYTVVPEPSNVILMAFAFGSVFLRRRRVV